MVYILLATYNGELYIKEQIESLLNQTYEDIKIFIRDDQSTDSTYSIIEGFVKRYPSKIFAAQNKVNSGNPKHNFIRLMIDNKSDYVLPCDQDDVWLSDKVENSIRKIQEMEAIYGKDAPLLAHSDLIVVNNSLDIVSASYMSRANFNYKNLSLNSLVVQNVITGCASIYNFALAKLMIEEPPFMIMHDWWIALLAITFGKIGLISGASILYRQHGKNNVGVNKVRSLRFLLSRLGHIKEMRKSNSDTYKQAKCFLETYDSLLDEKSKLFLKTFSSIPSMGKFKRITTTIRLKTLKHGFIRKIVQLCII